MRSQWERSGTKIDGGPNVKDHNVCINHSAATPITIMEPQETTRLNEINEHIQQFVLL